MEIVNPSIEARSAVSRPGLWESNPCSGWQRWVAQDVWDAAGCWSCHVFIFFCMISNCLHNQVVVIVGSCWMVWRFQRKNNTCLNGYPTGALIFCRSLLYTCVRGAPYLPFFPPLSLSTHAFYCSFGHFWSSVVSHLVGWPCLIRFYWCFFVEESLLWKESPGNHAQSVNHHKYS